MNSGRRIVLVVDDTPVNIDLLSGILKEHYKVKAATSGRKCLELARTSPQPDIILLDVMMPDLSGHEVCKALKEDPQTAHIPVIFVTAKAQAEDEQRGFILGAVDYITKPFNPVIVEARVRAQLTVHEQARRLRREIDELQRRVAADYQDFSAGELEAIIAAGESGSVEFKSTLRWNLHTDKTDRKIENQCLKTVAAFLNNQGGVLFVGVDDEGRATGLDKDRFVNEDKLLLHWNGLLKTHLGAECFNYVRSDIHDLQGCRILVVQCMAATKPVFFRRDNDEAFFLRMGNATQALKPSEVLAYIGQRFGEPK